MSETVDPRGARREGSAAAQPVDTSAPRAMVDGDVGVAAMGVELLATDFAYEQVERERDGARLAVVSLLAVMTDEQYRGVEKALTLIAAVSEIPRAALEELHTIRGRQRLAGEDAATASESFTAV